MDSLPACEIVATAAQCFNIGISIESPGPPPPAPHARHLPGAGGAAAAGHQAWRRSPALFWPSLFFKRLSALPAAQIPLSRRWLFCLFSKASLANFRSEEHTSELQSLMRISYAVFCLK